MEFLFFQDKKVVLCPNYFRFVIETVADSLFPHGRPLLHEVQPNERHALAKVTHRIFPDRPPAIVLIMLPADGVNGVLVVLESVQRNDMHITRTAVSAVVDRADFLEGFGPGRIVVLVVDEDIRLEGSRVVVTVVLADTRQAYLEFVRDDTDDLDGRKIFLRKKKKKLMLVCFRIRQAFLKKHEIDGKFYELKTLKSRQQAEEWLLSINRKVRPAK